VTLDAVSWPVATRRLSIRPVANADLPALFAIRSSPEVAATMPDHPTTYDEWLVRLGRTGLAEHLLAVELAGRVIGDLKLHVTDGWAQAEVRAEAARSQAVIGWCLSPEHRGRGYAVEAAGELVRLCFESLGLRRLTASTLSDNGPSLGVITALGMTLEAHHRRAFLHRTRGWVDVVEYALLADDERGGGPASAGRSTTSC
jgi:RimJ/RimL family protein N-acetyltransferase